MALRVFLLRLPLACLGLLITGESAHVQTEKAERIASSPRRELLRKEGKDIQSLKVAPVAFDEYRFTVGKTREGQSTYHISEFYLSDPMGEALNLDDPNVGLNIVNSQAINPKKLVDSDLSTSLQLTFDQPLVVRVSPGTLVAAFGFKTSEEDSGSDPTSFKLEGSMDGSTWYLLSEKTAYDTPQERGATVGPFTVSKLTALALGNVTLPAKALHRTSTTLPESTQSRSFERPVAVTTAPTTTHTLEMMTTTLDVVVAEAPVGPEVAQAVVKEATVAGLDTVDQAATATAVSKGLEALEEAKPKTEEGLQHSLDEAKAACHKVQKMSSVLHSAGSDHWSHLLKEWAAVAAKPGTPEEKVAAVVDASGDPDLAMHQHLATSAASASAWPAAVDYEAEVEPVALQGAALQPDGKVEVDAAAKERPENQLLREAITDVLKAAGIMASATPLDIPTADISDPDARGVLDAVAAKLEKSPVSAVEKVHIAAAAAEAYLKRAASISTLEAIGMLAQACLEAGLADAQPRIAFMANLTTAEQQAATLVLRAASVAIEVYLTTLLAEPLRPAPPLAAPVEPKADVPAPASTAGSDISSGLGNDFVFQVVPSSSSRSQYKAETGIAAKGFVFAVSLDAQGLVEFINTHTGSSLVAPELGMAYGRFHFTWPSASCSEEESGFTDFQSITFYNATFANPGESCGELLATTADPQGVIRFPIAGDEDLFRIAGMFGSKYSDSGGDMVKLSILDLVIFHIKGGAKVEYRVCGDPTSSAYVGCPEKSPLIVKYPQNSLGQGVKLCSGQAHFHEYKLENCFTA